MLGVVGVPGPTATPEPPAPAPPAAIAAPPPPPASACAGWESSPYLSSLMSAVPCPDSLVLSPEVVETNMGLSALFVLLFGVTAEVFNATIDENRRRIMGGWNRVMAGPARLLAPVIAAAAYVDNIGSSRPHLQAAFHALGILVAVGFIYGFLAREFTLDEKGLILVLSFIIGIGIITYMTQGLRALLVRQRFGVPATVRMYGTAVGIAIVAVVISRSMGLAPGLVFGFVATSFVLRPVALSRKDEAQLVFWPSVALIVLSLSAFLLLGEASKHANLEHLGDSFMESLLAVVFIVGLEGLVFTLLPLRFMNGAAVMRWNKWVWAILFGSAMFLWFQLLLNRDQAYVDAWKHTSLRVLVAGIVLFMGFTAAMWLYFRWRARGDEAIDAEEAGVEMAETGPTEA